MKSRWITRGTVRSAALGLTVAALAMCREASAQEFLDKGPLDLEDAAVTADVITGLGSPVGYGGVGLSLAPIEWIVVSAGAGHGSAGLQKAGMLRLRAGKEDIKLTLNLAYSTGPYSGFGGQCKGDCSSHYQLSQAHWFHLGWGFEWRTDEQIWWRFEWGLATLLNPGDARCVDRQTQAASDDCFSLNDHVEVIPLLLLAPLGQQSPCLDSLCADPLLYLNLGVGYPLF